MIIVILILTIVTITITIALTLALTLTIIMIMITIIMKHLWPCQRRSGCPTHSARGGSRAQPSGPREQSPDHPDP